VIYLGGFQYHIKEIGSINGKDISFEDFRIKVGNVEKAVKGSLHGCRK
jgi:peptidyl-prolyl cis-trans isomerase D